MYECGLQLCETVVLHKKVFFGYRPRIPSDFPVLINNLFIYLRHINQHRHFDNIVVSVPKVTSAANMCLWSQMSLLSFIINSPLKQTLNFYFNVRF